uniref:GG12463 n=1 Tax=Drosophila erecta TaxID=7220 RepID=B3P7G3_DROER
MKHSPLIASACLALVLMSSSLIGSAEARNKKKYVGETGGDFEFIDEINKNTQSSKNLGEHKRWIHDPSSDLCRPLNCKKREICLLEDEFSAVCVSKKELHKNRDEIITKAKYLEEEAKRRVNQQDSQDSQDAEDINNDDEDNSSDGSTSNSSPTGPNNAQASVQGNEETDDEDKSLSLGDDDESKEDDVFYENSIAAGDKQQPQQQQQSQPPAGPSVIQQDDDEELDNCKPCPVAKPTFLCGADNRTYSSLCRLDYHNCIHSTSIRIACKGFCPCKEIGDGKRLQRLSGYNNKYNKKISLDQQQQQQQQQQAYKDSSNNNIMMNSGNIMGGSNNDFNTIMNEPTHRTATSRDSTSPPSATIPWEFAGAWTSTEWSSPTHAHAANPTAPLSQLLWPSAELCVAAMLEPPNGVENTSHSESVVNNAASLTSDDEDEGADDEDSAEGSADQMLVF